MGRQTSRFQYSIKVFSRPDQTLKMTVSTAEQKKASCLARGGKNIRGASDNIKHGQLPASCRLHTLDENNAVPGERLLSRILLERKGKVLYGHHIQQASGLA